MESKMSQKLFNLNIHFFGDPNSQTVKTQIQTQTQTETDTILELVNETDPQKSVTKTLGENVTEIRPAADILEFSYPPESPFYKKTNKGLE
jgi:hypothetical protein